MRIVDDMEIVLPSCPFLKIVILIRYCVIPKIHNQCLPCIGGWFAGLSKWWASKFLSFSWFVTFDVKSNILIQNDKGCDAGSKYIWAQIYSHLLLQQMRSTASILNLDPPIQYNRKFTENIIGSLLKVHETYPVRNATLYLKYIINIFCIKMGTYHAKHLFASKWA